MTKSVITCGRMKQKQCTCLNETTVDVKAIWLECSELKNKPHLLLLLAGVITAAAFETADRDVIK